MKALVLQNVSLLVAVCHLHRQLLSVELSEEQRATFASAAAQRTQALPHEMTVSLTSLLSSFASAILSPASSHIMMCCLEWDPFGCVDTVHC